MRYISLYYLTSLLSILCMDTVEMQERLFVRALSQTLGFVPHNAIVIVARTMGGEFRTMVDMTRQHCFDSNPMS